MTGKIFLKLIAAVFAVLMVSLVAVDLMASRIAEASYERTLTRELEDKCRMIALDDLSQASPKRLTELARASGGRLTLVARDGSVIADSENEAKSMANHLDRPEVKMAMSGEVGSIRRNSSTMGMPFLYVAIPVREGALRLAVPMSQISAQVGAIRTQMLSATALAFLPAVLVSFWFARYASTKLGAIIEYAGQLAEGNFQARLKRQGPDELGELSAKLNETGEKLQAMFEQLQMESIELEKLERIRKDFVINVSHELRTPLASIQGYTETLLDGALEDPENNVRFLGIIRQNAERLARLTADLLTLSRIELGNTKFQFASYYANGLLRNSMDTLQPLADRKSISLRLIPAPDSTEVFCDSEAVHQILSNLIDNAIKYTPEGGSVTLAAYPIHSGANEMVEISVRDSGIGIPSEDVPRLFERFYRVDKARSRQMGGTGLGLAIVKHLALAQGGEARVESMVNQGSTFYFTLPVHDLGLLEHGAVQAQLTTL
ncbi:MAG: ATP-binding protein [Acidobacteria bacterium]|nr:ATP-binding protein [Acidobacteriota bacterium]